MLKMAGFPPNLDDGERWLPSDIFLGEMPSSTSGLKHQHFSNSMDDLAQHLAALSFPKQCQKSPSLSEPLQNRHLWRYRPPVRSAQLGPLSQSQRHLLFHGLQNYGSSFYGYETDELHRQCHYHLLNPAQLQVASFVETRNRVLQRPQNSPFPFRGSGIGSMGSFERVSGGTGVFHPRVLNATTTTTTNPEVKKKQGLRNSQEIKAIQQRKSIERVGMGNGEYYHQLRSDVCLPQDWTY